jgi:predicted nucleic acid-binding protein
MEAQRICLDTTFLIDLLRGLPAAVDKAEQLKEAGSDLITTSINAFELYIGVMRSASPKRSASLEALLADLRILVLGKGEAEESASIMADLMGKGETIEMRDALIAGCMLRNACPSIVTRNTRDFSRVAKIETIDY